MEHLASTNGSAEGFTLAGAQDHLFKSVPGLYEHGATRATIHRLFLPPNKKHGASRAFHGLVNAKVGRKTNNWRKQGPAVHYGRAAQRLGKEMFALFGQPIFSMDDMNIIQVGRSAVSRYHQTRRFFEEGLGYDQGTHDFPVSELGIKMFGVMLLGGDPLRRPRSNSF